MNNGYTLQGLFPSGSDSYNRNCQPLIAVIPPYLIAGGEESFSVSVGATAIR